MRCFRIVKLNHFTNINSLIYFLVAAITIDFKLSQILVTLFGVRGAVG